MPSEKIPGESQIKVRVLIECAHGSPNDIAVIDEAMLNGSKGQVDADPRAVAYAESLATSALTGAAVSINENYSTGEIV